MSPAAGPLVLAPGAASLSVAGDELIGPLADAVAPSPLPLAGGTIDVGTTRWPLVLCTLRADLETDALEVKVTLRQQAGAAGGPILQPDLRFAPWTEHGTQLVAFVPPVDAAGAAAAFTLRFAASTVAPDGAATALTNPQLDAAVRVVLVQGVLGRLAAVLLSEKGRVRRQARELRSMRRLEIARSDALDRMGRDVGAPRFRDEIAWDALTRQVGTVPLPGGGWEDDAAYRRRLVTLRPVRLPSPAWIDSVVNGPGSKGDAGAGWLADVGFGTRVDIDETPNPLLIAFRVVSPGGRGQSGQLLQAIRATHLVWPTGSPAGNAAHEARMVDPALRRRVDAARTALATLKTPPGQPVAPSVAYGLGRLLEAQARLGASPFGQVLGGQADAGGSRFELGLGARLAAPKAGELSKAVTAASNDAALRAIPVGDDPIGAWLLRACGLRTAHRLDDGSVYVSGLTSGGLVVDVAPAAVGPAPLELSARIETAVDAHHDAPLAAVIAALTGEGLALGQQGPLVSSIRVTGSNAELQAALANLGLPQIETGPQLHDIQARFMKLNPRDVAGFDLGAARSTAVAADPSKLASLLGVAARAGASSALPAVTQGGTLAVFVGVADLPLAGNNLAGHHTIAYRWQVRALVGRQPAFGPRRGASMTLSGETAGIAVVSCLAYIRDGGNDPYQWRPTLPTGTLLDLRQYEHLMNIVELVTPVGVRADTWAIRRQHVDVDGSGVPDPLPPSAARTYRRYRPQHP